MATSRQFALLRVLAAAAWADGRVDREEANRIKERMLRAQLSPDQVREIDVLLSAPVSYARCEELARDLLGLLPGRAERDEILGEIEEFLRSDGALSDEEAQVLDSLRGVMEAMTTVDGLLNRMTGVFRRVFGGRPPGAPPGDLSEFLKNAVLHRVDDLSMGTWRQRIDAETLNRHTLFGAVLGRVAQTEGGISPEESAGIRAILAGRLGLEPPLLDWVARAVEESAGAQLDRQGLLSEFNRIADHDERMRLLDAAFAVAAADGDVSAAELEELRLVANYLWLTPRDFHAVRAGWA